MSLKIVSFRDALALTEGGKRNLVVGNGFSIAARPSIFTYGSLFKQSGIEDDERLSAVFEALQTTDFEAAIRALELSSKLIPIYIDDYEDVRAAMLDDAAKLKDILIETVAANHPDGPFDFTDGEFKSCKKFLSNFIGAQSGGKIFTLNYDLLLYWALMHTRPGEAKSSLRVNDGFGEDDDNPGADYVVWHGETRAHAPSVFYLHGALHLFDDHGILQKFTWVRTGERLKDQARAEMDLGKYPLFVSEGSSAQKFDRIRHNAYLYQGLKTLFANANQRGHCFFIHGHSLDENDNHIFNLIGRGKCRQLAVSIHGGIDSAGGRQVVANVRRIESLRDSRYPVELIFYDSESAHIWDGAP